MSCLKAHRAQLEQCSCSMVTGKLVTLMQNWLWRVPNHMQRECRSWQFSADVHCPQNICSNTCCCLIFGCRYSRQLHTGALEFWSVNRVCFQTAGGWCRLQKNCANTLCINVFSKNRIKILVQIKNCIHSPSSDLSRYTFCEPPIYLVLSCSDGRSLLLLLDRCHGSVWTFGPWLLLELPYASCHMALKVIYF